MEAVSGETENIAIGARQTLFYKLKKDWKIILILTILILLGIVVRLVNYSDVGYWNDDPTTVPTALAWFYPHPIYPYPGYLGHGEPALGHLFIGAGCMLSGEDFSGVQKMYRDFYPGRGELIGKQLVNATKYCVAPIHFFGIIFLILVAILSYIIVKGRAAIYSTAFFAFYPFVLIHSRWIKVDVIMATFFIIGLLFLWKAYNLEKGAKKEIVYFCFGSAFISLAFAVRLTGAIFLPLPFLLIIEKYFSNILYVIKKILLWLNIVSAKKIMAVNADWRSLVKIMLLPAFSLIFFYLLPFKFHPSYAITVYNMYSSIHFEFSTIGLFLLNPFKVWHGLLLYANLFDTLIFFFSLYVFIRIIVKKDKTKPEKFILYLMALYLVALLITQSLQILRANMPFLVGFSLLAGLAFSDNEYSIFRILKIKKAGIVFGAFIIIYVIFSFSSAFANAPYYDTQNHLLCLFEQDNCNKLSVNQLSSFASKTLTTFLRDKMDVNETYLPRAAPDYYYLRSEEDILHYQFILPYRQQLGRDPSTKEKIAYFHPFGRQIRYIPVIVFYFTEDQNFLLEDYEPNWLITMHGKDIIFIYDVLNLTKKNL